MKTSLRVRSACALALVLMTPVVRAADAPRPALLEPRVIDASIAGVSLDSLDVALRIAVRAGRDLTIRSISFSDASVSGVSVWIAPVEGNWPLRPGQEVEIPSPVLVSARVIDALGADGLRDIIRDGSVAVRATVEVAFATPWPARLIMQPPTQTAISPVAIRVPIGTGPQAIQPFAALGAAIVDRLQREAAPFLLAGRNALPANRAVVERFSPSLVTVTTRYVIDDGTMPVSRSSQGAGFWWTRSVVCTTREALEPWRFDSNDAILLQAGGGRLRGERTTRIESASRGAIEIDASNLERRLGQMQERKVFALHKGRPRRIRLSERDASSSIACLRVTDDSDGDRSLAPALSEFPVSAAVFAVQGSRGPLWTDVVRDRESALTLTRPVYRHSFGSPLVTADGLVGIAVSSTRAWDFGALSVVAARAPRVASHTAGKAAE